MRKANTVGADRHNVGQKLAQGIGNQEESQRNNGRGRVTEVEENIEGTMSFVMVDVLHFMKERTC